MSAYLGKATENQIGLNHDETEKAIKSTKRRAANLSTLTADRGLLSPSYR